MNKNIEKYTTSSGATRYKFQIYVTKDETTGKSILIRKQGFTSEDKALESFYLYKHQVDTGKYNPTKQKRIRFKELYELWLSRQYEKSVEESTLATTTRIFKNHILPVLGDYYVDKITVSQCQNIVEQWAMDAPKTFKRYIRYTNNVLNYGAPKQFLDRNPMLKVQRPKIKQDNKKFTDFYSKEELDEFLNACKKSEPFEVFVFFNLLAYSGMRKGEALALTWNDINFGNNTISIDKALTIGKNNKILIHNPKTKNSNRKIPMNKPAMKYLKQWQQKQRKELFKLGINSLDDSKQIVFQNQKNKHYKPTKTTDWMNRICKKNGLRHIKVHGFRHTHASLLFEAGVTMEEVKARLGHANIATTMDIYTHVTENTNKNAIDKFSAYMES